MLSNNKQLSVGSDLFRFREFIHLSSRSRRNCQTALNVSAAPFQSSSSAWHSNEVPQLANIVLIQRQRSLRTTPHHYIGNHNNGRTHPGPAEQSAYNIQTIIVTCPTRLVSQLRTAQAGTSEDNTYQAQTRTHFSPLKRHVSSQTSPNHKNTVTITRHWNKTYGPAVCPRQTTASSRTHERLSK